MDEIVLPMVHAPADLKGDRQNREFIREISVGMFSV